MSIISDGPSKPHKLVFICDDGDDGDIWKPWFPPVLGSREGMLRSMEPNIQASDHQGALRVLLERYGNRLLSHEFLAAEREGGVAVPAIVIEISPSK